MLILGISAYYHDSAIALLENDKILFALQEERISRKKGDERFPKESIKAMFAFYNKAQNIDYGGGSTLNPLCLDSIDAFIFYDKPFLTFERLLETYLTTAPKGLLSFMKAIPLWLSSKLFLKETLSREFAALYEEFNPTATPKAIKAFKKRIYSRIYFAEHHISHAASAFFPSPYNEAGILTLDGLGEWSSTSIAKGSGNHIEILREIHFPHSLGLLYSAFTYYLGFKVNSGEYKVMGLAPYGTPRFANLIKEKLIDIKEDGSFALDMSYFSYTYGLKMTNAKFDSLFHAKRTPESTLTQIHMDIAASIQEVTQEIMLKLARSTAKLCGSRNLVLSGGVALNCVGNGMIYRKLVVEEKILDNIWIQPASGDSGSSLGCALTYYYMECNNERKLPHKIKYHTHNKDSATIATKAESTKDSTNKDSANVVLDSLNPMTDSPQNSQAKIFIKAPLDSMQGSYLGISYTNDEVESTLQSLNATYKKYDFSELVKITALALTQGKVIGWHQGRCEFGPRALGARSILGDSRNPNMQKTMNLKIKYRESFRPFAPSVLDYKINEYFELHYPSPYMLLVAPIKENLRKPISEESKNLFGIDKLNVARSEIPSVTHIDYSARIQSVHKAINPRYYALLEEFYRLSGCAVLVNTSFNVRGEPMVCSPLDSYRCFMGTEMDMLVIEDFILYKESQSLENIEEYKAIKDKYELD